MATIADVARKAGVSVSTVSHVVNGTRRVAPATAQAVQSRHRCDRLSPERPGPVPQDGLDPIGRHRHLRHRQRLFHRHHLRDRSGMRASWHDGLPLGHPGRCGAGARGRHRPSPAPGGRRHSGPERRSGTARARLSARRPPALRARRSQSGPRVRSGRREQSRGDAGTRRICPGARSSPRWLRRRPSGLPDDDRAHRTATATACSASAFRSTNAISSPEAPRRIPRRAPRTRCCRSQSRRP